jgi:hypothetical protein
LRKAGLRKAWLLAALVLAGCAAPDAHAPPFANVPYAAFSRTDAIAVAMGEWRLWGSRVDDNDDAGYVQHAATMAERQPGLWERVGEYWWQGMNAGHSYDRWTGKHNANGQVFPVAENGRFAWSAAFISYVMRMAGAGPDFPYAPDHAHYIDYAARAAEGKIHDPELIARNPAAYAPRPGDLVCFGRGWARDLTFQDLPTGRSFPAHCAIVVAAAPGLLSAIGGNVEDAVVMQHLHTDAQGLLQGNAQHWFVVLQVEYKKA